MYARYKKIKKDSDVAHFTFEEKISLFGCNNGFIPWLLQFHELLEENKAYCWHLDIEKELEKTGEYPDSSLVIDLKPKQYKTNVSLYEVFDVWGYSSEGWTPILLHLKGLFMDEDPLSVNRNDFIISNSENSTPIYEVLYLDGSIENGKLVGKWTAPPASPTNAALLWTEVLNYFVKCIRERTPNVIKFED